MIDLHCHILPGVDDGPAAIEESVAMAAAAVRDGTRTIVATPHGGEWSYNGTFAETLQRTGNLQAELARRGIELELLAGLEVHIAPDLASRHARGNAFTLNGSRYLLVELPFQVMPAYTEQALFDLQLRQLVPVIAHPERNAQIVARPEILKGMVDRGMLAQVTAGSLTGLFGQKTREAAELLLTHNLVHVIASDGHSASDRGPILSAAVKRAGELIGQEAAEAMVTTTPLAIIHDDTITAPEAEPLEPRRSWFPLGRKKC